MLKVVIYDSGYGGENFADALEQALPVVEVIRVIDWRNADKILLNSKSARRVAIEALRPYIGNVDLIIFANHLLTLTSLNYFRRKYHNQKFIGLDLKEPTTFVDRDILILTTKAVARTLEYKLFVHGLKRHTSTLTVDSWPAKIDDGELSEDEIKTTITSYMVTKNIQPEEVILACAQFNDIEQELKNVLGKSLIIHDSFNDAIREACKVLKVRGSVKKKK